MGVVLVFPLHHWHQNPSKTELLGCYQLQNHPQLQSTSNLLLLPIPILITPVALVVDVILDCSRVIHPWLNFIHLLLVQFPEKPTWVTKEKITCSVHPHPPPWEIRPGMPSPRRGSLCRLKQKAEEDESLHKLEQEGGGGSFFKLRSLCRLHQNHGSNKEGQHGETRGGETVKPLYTKLLTWTLFYLHMKIHCACVCVCVCAVLSVFVVLGAGPYTYTLSPKTESQNLQLFFTNSSADYVVH